MSEQGTNKTREQAFQADATEAELRELFLPFGELHATDELKERTLERIFAQLDEEEAMGARPQAQAVQAEAAQQEPAFSLVEADATPDDTAAQDAFAQPARRRRPRGWRLRIAAAVAAISFAVGGVAYAVPASHVTVTQDDVTVELGVNVYGVTVSVNADDDEVSALLNDARVRHLGYKEALVRVLDVCEQRGEVSLETVSVEVSGPFAGQEHQMGETVERMVEERGSVRADEPQNQQPSDGPATDDGQVQEAPAEAGQRGEQPSPGVEPEAHSAPGQDGGPGIEQGETPTSGPEEGNVEGTAPRP